MDEHASAIDDRLNARAIETIDLCLDARHKGVEIGDTGLGLTLVLNGVPNQFRHQRPRYGLFAQSFEHFLDSWERSGIGGGAHDRALALCV